MALNHIAGYSRLQAAAADLNQAAATVLASVYLPAGGFVRRLSLVSEASQGLLAVNELRVSYSLDGGATYVDPTNDDDTAAVLDVASARARGILVVRDLGITIPPGALVAVRVKVDAGGASTGRIVLEYQDEPYNGVSKPTTAVDGTGTPV